MALWCPLKGLVSLCWWTFIVVCAACSSVGVALASPVTLDRDEALHAELLDKARVMDAPTPWPMDQDAASLEQHKRQVQSALNRHSERSFRINAHTFMPSYDKSVQDPRKVAAQLSVDHLPALVAMGQFRVIFWMGQPGREVLYHLLDNYRGEYIFDNILVTTGVGYFSVDPLPNAQSLQWLKYLYIRHILTPSNGGYAWIADEMHRQLLANIQDHLHSPGIEPAVQSMCFAMTDFFSPVACGLLPKDGSSELNHRMKALQAVDRAALVTLLKPPRDSGSHLHITQAVWDRAYRRAFPGSDPQQACDAGFEPGAQYACALIGLRRH